MENVNATASITVTAALSLPSSGRTDEAASVGDKTKRAFFVRVKTDDLKVSTLLSSRVH